MNKPKNTLLLTLGALLLLLVTISGFWATDYMTRKIETDERSNLLLRAQTVAALIDTQALSELKGTSSDALSPSYAKIKDSLESVRDINTDARFVYILGQRDGKQFFQVDAENPESKDFSAPGDAYDDARPADIANYLEKVPYTKGPYTDAWGSWFSAFAPITSSDGTMLGELTMDIHSDKLLLRIAIVKQATIIIFGLLFLSVLVVLILLHDNNPFRKK